MKNYEVKYATKEIATLGTPKLANKRLAYLVPNMFGKMKTGFAKKINSIIVAYQEESSKIAVVEQPAPVVEQTVVSTPVQPIITAPVQPEVAPAPVAPTPVQSEVAPAPVVEQPAPVQTTNTPVDDEKRFIIKAYLADFAELRKNSIKVISAPKKLLIPVKFKTSLFDNYIKNKEVSAVQATPVVEQATIQQTPVQNQQQAVLEYIALNNDMKNLIKEIEEIKSKMINLAKEHGLTRSMVESAMKS